MEDLQGNDVNQFFLSYRDALKNNYDSAVSALKQNKRNDDASIMSSANRQGLMYSNFPQRAKIQTESTYLNNLANARNSYQTGLDKLRSNAVNTYNTIKSYQEAISDLNDATAKLSSGGTSGTGGTSGGDGTSGDNVKTIAGTPYAVVQDSTGTHFYNVNTGDPVTYSTVANAAGVSASNADYINGLKEMNLNKEADAVQRILNAQGGRQEYYYNTGPNKSNEIYNYLSPEDNAILKGLGLGLRDK